MGDKKRALIIVGLGVLLLPLLALLPATAAPTATIPSNGNTTLIFQNIGTGTASVVVQYIDEGGSVDATKAKTVAPNGAGVISAAQAGLPDDWRGSTILFSDQPLAPVVEISWSGQGDRGAAYNGLSSPGTEIYLPDVATSADTDTQITVQNASDTDGDVYLYYYAAGGTETASGPHTIAKGAEKAFNPSDVVGTNWSGSVQITSTVDIAAVVTRHWTKKSAAYEGLSGGGTALHFPLIYRQKEGNKWTRYTEVQVQNLSDSLATFSLYFYDGSGSLKNVGGTPYTVDAPARGSLRFNMKNGGGGLTSSQVNFGTSWNGSLVVTSTVDMAGTANEIFPQANRAGASVAEESGSSKIYLPSLYRRLRKTNWMNFSEISIQNVGDSPTTVTVKFYTRGGILKKTIRKKSLPAKASYRFTTQETRFAATLGNKFQGTAVVIISGNVVALVYNKVGPRSYIYNGLRQ